MPPTSAHRAASATPRRVPHRGYLSANRISSGVCSAAVVSTLSGLLQLICRLPPVAGPPSSALSSETKAHKESIRTRVALSPSSPSRSVFCLFSSLRRFIRFKTSMFASSLLLDAIHSGPLWWCHDSEPVSVGSLVVFGCCWLVGEPESCLVSVQGFCVIALKSTTNAMPFTCTDICKLILAFILPPVGVFLEKGCDLQLAINILLTLLGYIPGIIHAIWVIFYY